MKSTTTGEEPHGARGHRARRGTYESGSRPPAGAAPGALGRTPPKPPPKEFLEATTEPDTKARGADLFRQHLHAKRGERRGLRPRAGRGEAGGGRPRRGGAQTRGRAGHRAARRLGRVRRPSSGPGREPAPRPAPRALGPQPSPPPDPRLPPPKKRGPHSGAPSPRARRRPSRMPREPPRRGGGGRGSGGGKGPNPGWPSPLPPPRCRVWESVRAPPPPPRLPAPTPARRLNEDRTRRLDPIRPRLVRSLAGLTGSCFSDSLEAGCTLEVVVQQGSAGDHGNPFRVFSPPTEKGSSLD